MISVLLPYLKVLYLGFLCGLIPGPVVTSIFTQTIRQGSRSAYWIILWAGIGEIVMSVTCVTALSFLDPQSKIFATLSIFGALILLNLSWDLWKIEEIPVEEPLFSRKRIFFISLLNGMAWIFWITVCTPLAVNLGAHIQYGQWLFILLFEIGWATSTLALCHLFGLFRPYFQNNKKLHLLYRTVAVLFVLFALKLSVTSVRTLLQSL